MLSILSPHSDTILDEDRYNALSHARRIRDDPRPFYCLNDGSIARVLVRTSFMEQSLSDFEGTRVQWILQLPVHIADGFHPLSIGIRHDRRALTFDESPTISLWPSGSLCAESRTSTSFPIKLSVIFFPQSIRDPFMTMLFSISVFSRVTWSPMLVYGPM